MCNCKMSTVHFAHIIIIIITYKWPDLPKFTVCTSSHLAGNHHDWLVRLAIDSTSYIVCYLEFKLVVYQCSVCIDK